MKYRIRWRIDGTTYIEAKDEEEAEAKFDEIETYDLLDDIISKENYGVEEKWYG
jgi:hypothetical protein